MEALSRKRLAESYEMIDQAARLRELVQTTGPAVRAEGAGPPMVVVTGGKGGVGATTVAANLAAALADRGSRVVLVDAAKDRADLAEVAGVDVVGGRPLSDVLSGKCSVADALAPGPVGTLLLADRWASQARSDYSRRAQHRLLAGLNALGAEADLVVVDTGSGMTSWTRRFWRRAQAVLAVTTSDDVAVLDTYATIKLGTAEAPASGVCVLVNQSESDRQANEASERLTAACRRFLGRTITPLAPLPRHRAEGDEFGCCGPRVWEAPNSPFGHAVLWLGRAVSDCMAAVAATKC